MMTYQEFIEFQRKNATWDKKPFAQYVALQLLDISQELGLKALTKAYVGKGRGLYQTTCITFPHLNLHIQTTSIQDTEKLKLEDIKQFNIYYPSPKDIFVIDTTKGLEHVNLQLEKAIELIKKHANHLPKDYRPWRIENDYNLQTFIHPGKIHINDHKYFQLVTEILALFGDDCKACMQGEKKHNFEPNTVIWWPKFGTEQDGWINQLHSNGNVITEKNIDPCKNTKLVQDYLALEDHYKIVFTSVRIQGKQTYYIFKGVYQLDKARTNETNGGVFVKIADEATTYQHLL